MRRPQISCDKKECKVQCPPQPPSSSGPFARMRRFLAVSIGGRQSPPSQSSLKRPCDSISSPVPHELNSLRSEAEMILGRPLEDVMRDEEKEQPHGVPSFVHDVCCHMLTHGVDYETLVGDDWCPDRASILEALPLTLSGDLSSEGAKEATAAAGIFRLFLQELPHPLLSRDVTAALTRICKELDCFDEGSRDGELFEDLAVRVRSVLSRKVPPVNLSMLQYLTAFLHQLRTANHNTCPVTASALSRLLGLVLTEGGMKEETNQSSFRLAEMLLLNHAIIFRDSAHLSQEANYSSDSVSSNCDSRGETTDEADLFTPDDDDDEDDDEGDTIGRGLSSEIDAEEDSTTTTTTDTDEFRSPPVSPIRSAADHPPAPGTSSPAGMNRSTDELSDGDGFITKITPYGKDYLPSITGLLTSPYESWSLDVFRPKEESYTQNDSAESSCISGEEVSELESEEDRDADGSDAADGVGAALKQQQQQQQQQQEMPSCPHEERRSSERVLLRGHHHSSSTVRKTKRRIRRKHTSKDLSSRIQSSEEEERGDPPLTFASLLSRNDSSPAPFDPTPPESSQSFCALLSSEEPVTSYRALWGPSQEEDDNWQRTAPHYSREDDDIPLKAGNWYREESVDDAYRSSKFCDPTHADPLDEGSRPRGHSAMKLLTKNVNGLKKKIKRFEEEFERINGYRPSHSEKMKHKEIKKYMSELSKAKKELKQMKEDIPESKIRSFPKPFPMSLLRCQESTNSGHSQAVPSSAASSPSHVTKDTYRQVEDRLSVKRCDAGRSTKVADLTLEELKEEKTDIQKALLFYESVHGRPSNREDKELVRPLYDRYRLVKRSVNKLISRPKENVVELAPILEHVVMDFTLASPQHRGSLKEEEDDQEDTMATHPLNPDRLPEVITYSSTELNLGDLHALPIHELKERKKEARDEKRKLRHSLRDYEERFERETGRKMQKEDRGPMEKNYNEYKHVKAKLRLLEALLSKHDS